MKSFYEKIIAICPYAKTLGVQFSCDQKGLYAQLCYHENLVGNPLAKALHGGAIGSFMEITAIADLIYKIPEFAKEETPKPPKPINLSIAYLGKAECETLYARGHLAKQGRRVVHISVTAWQKDESRPTSVLAAHFLL